MTSRTLAIFLVALLSFTSARLYRGDCDEPELITDFDVESYLGLWYEQYRDAEFRPSGEDGDCVTAHYDLYSNGKVQVYNSQIRDKNPEERGSIYGKAKCEEDSSQCTVAFFLGLARGDYRVISTDYTSYSVVYSCQRVPFLGWFGFKNVGMWILARS